MHFTETYIYDFDNYYVICFDKDNRLILTILSIIQTKVIYIKLFDQIFLGKAVESLNHTLELCLKVVI